MVVARIRVVAVMQERGMELEHNSFIHYWPGGCLGNERDATDGPQVSGSQDSATNTDVETPEDTTLRR